MAEAAAECRRLEAPGADWANELWRAIEAANLAERQSRPGCHRRGEPIQDGVVIAEVVRERQDGH